MRLSEFKELMADEFGRGYGEVIVRDLVLSSLEDQTGQQALAAGVDPRVIWLAICQANAVPKERWTGRLATKKPSA